MVTPDFSWFACHKSHCSDYIVAMAVTVTGVESLCRTSKYWSTGKNDILSHVGPGGSPIQNHRVVTKLMTAGNFGQTVCFAGDAKSNQEPIIRIIPDFSI
jgi:hypothetical protein